VTRRTVGERVTVPVFSSTVPALVLAMSSTSEGNSKRM
jgi:hypothetical protein